MKQHRISVIFKNASSADTSVDSIAKDANGKIYPFDAMETGSTDNDAYEVIMKNNLASLKQAFE